MNIFVIADLNILKYNKQIMTVANKKNKKGNVRYFIDKCSFTISRKVPVCHIGYAFFTQKVGNI